MDILLLTPDPSVEPARVLPALDLLPHTVRTARRDVGAPLPEPRADALLVDALAGLAEARAVCRLLHATGRTAPLLAVVTEAGLAAVHPDWGVDDVVLATAGPAEVEARLRLAAGRTGQSEHSSSVIRAGDLTIDPETYAARIKGRPLDLTYKEFELLRFLAQHPGRVFHREQLLREVWGYDYYGGTRTVDVHVRRLRAKLGNEYESMIGTVRQVGYRLVVAPPRVLPEDEPARPVPEDEDDPARSLSDRAPSEDDRSTVVA